MRKNIVEIKVTSVTVISTIFFLLFCQKLISNINGEKYGICQAADTRAIFLRVRPLRIPGLYSLLPI